MRTCRACRQEKPLSEFGKSSAHKGGVNRRCRACMRVYRNEWGRSNKAKINARRLVLRYGITAEQYADMMKWQDGKCRICEIDFSCSMKPHVDHCHKTKRVRALLCGPCNRGLGFFRDSPNLLDKAIEYLNPNNKEE